MVPDGLAGAQTSSLDCSAEIQLFLFSKGKRRWDHARTTLENSLSTLENSRSTRNQAQFVKHVAMTLHFSRLHRFGLHHLLFSNTKWNGVGGMTSANQPAVA